ncbi:MAG TPA: hypothetical protein GX401_01795 [Clostridiales bacterium]|nr:hypothetical protein [Clostridiales bacterium]
MRKLFILAAAVLMLSLAGCDSGATLATEVPTQTPTQKVTQAPTQPSTAAPTEAPTQAETIVDNSQLKPVTGSWMLWYYENSDGTTQVPNSTIQYLFEADGTFTAVVAGNEATGTYTFDGETLLYTADASGEEGTFIYDSTNKVLIDEGAGGKKAVLTNDMKRIAEESTARAVL